MTKMKIEWIEKYMREAETLIYDNQVDEGLHLLNELLYDEPGYGSLHNHIGWAYLYYTGDLQKAEQHFLLAIKFDCNYAAPYLHLGNLYTRIAKYDEALRYFERGLAKPDANRVAFFEDMGRVHEMKRDYTRAIKFYKEAMLSSHGFEMNNLNENIKRCKKKRLINYFTF